MRLEDIPEARARKFGPGLIQLVVDFSKEHNLKLDNFPDERVGAGGGGGASGGDGKVQTS